MAYIAYKKQFNPLNITLAHPDLAPAFLSIPHYVEVKT